MPDLQQLRRRAATAIGDLIDAATPDDGSLTCQTDSLRVVDAIVDYALALARDPSTKPVTGPD